MSKYGKQRLIEMMNKVAGTSLNEIDWEDTFSDVSKTCINTEQLKEYLNDRIRNSELKPHLRRREPLDKPHVHLSALNFDEGGEIDVESFIKNITQFPNKILGKNEKIKKSEDETSVGYNIGIPALRGLVYDLDGKEFYIVNTCPGAGSCAAICYAKRGNYIQYPASFVNKTRILNFLLNHPDKFEQVLEHEIEIEILKNENKRVVLRWNDSGDFFGKKFYEIATNITRNLIEKGYNFQSYGYTKMGDIINVDDPNMTLNFSDNANKKETEKVDAGNIKGSKIVPQTLFDDLFVRNSRGKIMTNAEGKLEYKDPNGLDTLKDRISKKYDVDKNRLLSYDELLKTPEGKPNQYDVIVLPKGEGDVSAQRKDVKTTFLLFH